ncbi:MAG TPA: CPXCG motif-containing cysteine-rich protein [Kofleriaceae bacterium]|nr:CPXCG motif-containing cysteine-rich protein [Kofleriaceae bacterium]
METEVQCPYCGEWTTVTGDEAGGRSVEDCVVCCRPIDVVVSVSEDGELSVTARRQDE